MIINTRLICVISGDHIRSCPECCGKRERRILTVSQKQLAHGVSQTEEEYAYARE